MSSILLKQVLLDGQNKDIFIENGIFTEISDSILLTKAPDQIIYGWGNLAILPPFYNGHTHAAMSLFRGYADDHELFDWLSNYVWPLEAKLTENDVYVGTKLAILEMIHSGTVFFNDMYWFQKGTIRAVDEMGVRANVGIMVLSQTGSNARTANKNLREGKIPHSNRVCISMAPHAIYTVNEKELRECAAFARANGLPITIHLAETKKEFDDCIREHGMTPTAYLDKCGLVTENSSLAHAVWLTDDDFKIIADRNAILVHNPISNAKLCSGTFRYTEARNAGCRVIIGTDSSCSNNNLSMFEEVKFSALTAKASSGNPKTLPADEAFRMATTEAADAFGIKAGIKTGCAADFMLVKTNDIFLSPGHNLISDIVYAADRSCIDTVACNGKILMQNGHIPGEEEIIREAKSVTRDLLRRN